ncbi:glycosyltransferase family 39 protein [Methyloversatilis thermotolerans]|uniref:glycosyltransferase family 39 protein n=1 Tax=Methyloversatilis thermotolerans TaxID=1346290 RepID=UPI000366BDD6|nr:glycosyltransferase family 39 protein [Methyloversatilis thermotolerans]
MRTDKIPAPLLLLLIYFGSHVLLRVLASGALELDEAEQALWTQHLAAGYGSQPPLYTWLQWAVFQTFGVSVLSLALLKNLLLAATYGFVYAAARRVMPPAPAILSAACMLLIPQIGWESQRDLTHSVLVTAVAAAHLCLIVRLIERPRPALYAWLGLAIGLGMLSKYSFAVHAAASVLALMAAHETRLRVLSPWLALSALVAALVFLPHALWLTDNWQLASTRTLEKLDTTSGGAPAAMLRGLLSLTSASAATLGLLALVCALLFGRALLRDRMPARTSVASDTCRFLRRYFIALYALLLALIVIGGATHFKGRWLQPLLFLAPMALFCCRPALAQHRRLPALRAVLVVFALCFLALAGLRPVLDGWRNRPDELNEPIDRLARTLAAEGFDGRQAIVTDDPVLGGVLRVRYPDAEVAVWKSGAPSPAARNRPHLLIGKIDGGLPLFERAGEAPPAPLRLPYLHAHPGHAPVEYRYARLPAAAANPPHAAGTR